MKFGQRGFTIIEILISLFILGAALLVFQASINTLTVNKFLKYQDLALRIANSEIETLKINGYDSIPASGSFAHSNLSLLPSGQGTLTVSDYNVSTKQVVVTVSWRGTKQHSLSLTTLITKNGL